MQKAQIPQDQLVVEKSLEMQLQQAADLINNFAIQGMMLEVTPAQLEQLYHSNRLVMAYDDLGNVIGTAALTFQYSDGTFEFGGWAIDPKWQHQGIGKRLFIQLLKQLAPGTKVIAFGNSNSAPILLRCGGVIMDQTAIHPDAFIACQTCHCDKSKLSNGSKCIDLVIDLTHLISQFSES